MSTRQDGNPENRVIRKAECKNGHPNIPENRTSNNTCKLCRADHMRERRESDRQKREAKRIADPRNDSANLGNLWKDRPKTLSDADDAAWRAEERRARRDERIAQRNGESGFDDRLYG